MGKSQILPINDKDLNHLKQVLAKGGVGISSHLVASLIVRLELSEHKNRMSATSDLQPICLNCQLDLNRCDCEVSTAAN